MRPLTLPNLLAALVFFALTSVSDEAMVYAQEIAHPRSEEAPSQKEATGKKPEQHSETTIAEQQPSPLHVLDEVRQCLKSGKAFRAAETLWQLYEIIPASEETQKLRDKLLEACADAYLEADRLIQIKVLDSKAVLARIEQKTILPKTKWEELEDGLRLKETFRKIAEETSNFFRQHPEYDFNQKEVALLGELQSVLERYHKAVQSLAAAIRSQDSERVRVYRKDILGVLDDFLHLVNRMAESNAGAPGAPKEFPLAMRNFLTPELLELHHTRFVLGQFQETTGREGVSSTPKLATKADRAWERVATTRMSLAKVIRAIQGHADRYDLTENWEAKRRLHQRFLELLRDLKKDTERFLEHASGSDPRRQEAKYFLTLLSGFKLD